MFYQYSVVVAVCIAASFNTVPMLAQDQSKSGDDWPRFLGPNIDGSSPLTGISKDWTGGGLPLIWQTDVGEGYGMGSVAAGHFFHFDKIDGQARLRCLDAATGDVQWDFTYPSTYVDLYGYDSGPRTSPLIDDGRVYLFGVEGMLHCIDAADGKPIWKVDTQERFGVIQNFFGVASSPVIYQDKLLVMIGGSPAASRKAPPGRLDQVKPNGSAVVAFDKQTGNVVYQTGNDLASYASLTWMKRNREPLLLAWCRNNLLGIAPQDGEVKFEFPWRSPKLESVNAATPLAVGQQFFVSECYGPGSLLGEFDGKKIKVIWSDQKRRKKSLQAHWGTPVLFEGHLYGCSGRNSGGATLRCIELKTGTVKWQQTGFGRCSVALVDGHLVVLGEGGRLALVQATPEKYTLVTERPNTGKFTLVPNCWAGPLIAGKYLYVRGGKKLGCFRLAGASQTEENNRSREEKALR